MNTTPHHPHSSCLPSLTLKHRHHLRLLLCLALSPPTLSLLPPPSISRRYSMTQPDRWIPMEQRVSNGWAKRLFSCSQPVAGDAISGQLALPACFLYLTIAFPAGDTPELLCPPEDSVRQADLCARTWPSHQPPLHYGVSAYWQYSSQLRFTAILALVSTSLSLCICLPLTVSPWAPDLPDPLSLSLVVALICLLEAFSLFPVLWQGNQSSVNKHMGHSHLPRPQWDFCCCFLGMCVTRTWV